MTIISFKPVSAVTTQSENSDFEVQPILPTFQTNRSLNYFDLKIGKGKTAKIQMHVVNFSDKEITVKTSLRNAETQVGGGVSFTKETKEVDPTLKHPMTTFASVNQGDQKLTLKPNEDRVITATIKMPKDDFKGMIYGDWYFIEESDAKTAVKSNYAYSVGIALRGSDDNVHPNLIYDKTEPILYRKHPAMGIKLRNINAMVLKDVKVKAVVSSTGSFSSKRVAQLSGGAVAPNSVFTIPITWGYSTLKPGKYHIEAKVTGKSVKNGLPITWDFKQDFTVKESDTKVVNEQALKKPINKWAYLAVASGAGLTALSVGLYQLLKMKG